MEAKIAILTKGQSERERASNDLIAALQVCGERIANDKGLFLILAPQAEIKHLKACIRKFTIQLTRPEIALYLSTTAGLDADSNVVRRAETGTTDAEDAQREVDDIEKPPRKRAKSGDILVQSTVHIPVLSMAYC